MTRLLIVDDEPSICWGLKKLGERMGHEVDVASSAEQAIDAVREQSVDAIVLDVRLPGMDGLEAMQHLRAAVPNAPIIVITAHGNLSTAVKAVRKGAFEYIVKPFDLEQIERVLKRAFQPAPPAVEIAPHDEQVDGLVGKTAVMQEVFKRIALVAARDACVLLQGESGTGKELVARAVHRYSRRASGPFVAVNVASVSASLAESELFGHVKGAFTGADQARGGLLAQADGGTLFLDEVADIPQPTQVKLLRALEHGEVTPVGSSEPVQADFRVISATHQSLQSMVDKGTFRHDLFYRLCTFQIDLPPLRDRRQDIHRLAAHFVRALSDSSDSPDARLSPAVIKELESRPWYGNVRELRNAVEHALIVAREGTITADHLPPALSFPPSADADQKSDPTQSIATLIQRWAEEQLNGSEQAGELYDRLLELVEPPLLEAALKKHRGQCAAAARTLGVHRTTLRKKLDRYGIDDDD